MKTKETAFCPVCHEEQEHPETIKSIRMHLDRIERLEAALSDAHDFIHALHEATTGENQINKHSILRYGEKLKTTAATLDAKLAKALKGVTLKQPA